MHDPNFALKYCDDILILKNGKIAEVISKADSINEIKSKLSLIYQNIDVIEYLDTYIMVKTNE